VDTYVDNLARAIDEAVAPSALDVDAKGRFPTESIEALRSEGILGLTMPAALGGGGASLADAVAVVSRLAEVCGSTAMVVLMHYAASAVLAGHGDEKVTRAIAEGRHLSTLAFSEVGSRHHFWSPISTATAVGEGVRLDGQKSWVTASAQADSYVWSSRPRAAEGPMTLWFVPSDTPGLTCSGEFDGLGLRGNNSTPVEARGVIVPSTALLGEDGEGLSLALTEVLPCFLLLSAAFSVGLMEAATAETGAHLRSTRLEHLGQRLADQPLSRVDHARMRLATDQSKALLNEALSSLADGREEAMLRILEVKAAAAEAAVEVTLLALKLCGGAAFRKELGIERRHRDALAARVMAPTTDALLDFIGRAINGLPLL
jgi:alkylation response protein AidB-like acyl-CoA dehydrogenase